MKRILEFYTQLCDEVDGLTFSYPVMQTYNPLRYAWHGFSQYMEKSPGKARVVFVGINPGPWGMTQTGVPFGEINAVKNFLGIRELDITPPENEHPSYPVQGLKCQRSEVSGRRLWALFQEHYGTAENFFADAIVLNYCPLFFIARTDAGGIRNFTPDKLNQDESEQLFEYCDMCLIRTLEILRPEFVVGIGNFAYKRAKTILISIDAEIVKILHPSPASPAANKDWSGKVTEQLRAAGVWV